MRTMRDLSIMQILSNPAEKDAEALHFVEEKKKSKDVCYSDFNLPFCISFVDFECFLFEMRIDWVD